MSLILTEQIEPPSGSGNFCESEFLETRVDFRDKSTPYSLRIGAGCAFWFNEEELNALSKALRDMKRRHRLRRL